MSSGTNEACPIKADVHTSEYIHVIASRVGVLKII